MTHPSVGRPSRCWSMWPRRRIVTGWGRRRYRWLRDKSLIAAAQADTMRNICCDWRSSCTRRYPVYGTNTSSIWSVWCWRRSIAWSYPWRQSWVAIPTAYDAIRTRMSVARPPSSSLPAYRRRSCVAWIFDCGFGPSHKGYACGIFPIHYRIFNGTMGYKSLWLTMLYSFKIVNNSSSPSYKHKLLSITDLI